VAVDIASKRRAEVSVDLKPVSAKTKLSVHDLRPRDPDQERITGVGIEWDREGNRFVVHLEIPGDRPAGVYTGLIVDSASNLPQGFVSVRIFDPLAGES
jgi:hypothetical protein